MHLRICLAPIIQTTCNRDHSARQGMNMTGMPLQFTDMKSCESSMDIIAELHDAVRLTVGSVLEIRGIPVVCMLTATLV